MINRFFVSLVFLQLASTARASGCFELAEEVRQRRGGTNLGVESQWGSGAAQYYRYGFDRGANVCQMVILERFRHSGPGSRCIVVQPVSCYNPNQKFDRPSWW